MPCSGTILFPFAAGFCMIVPPHESTCIVFILALAVDLVTMGGVCVGVTAGEEPLEELGGEYC